MNETAKASPLAALLFAGLLAAVAPVSSSPVPQEDATCLHCHARPGLKSESGQTVYVDGNVYDASVHGQAGVNCVDCHRELKDVKQLPHAKGLAAVRCADCHADYARTTTGGVHDTWSPRLEAAPVLCRDCHGGHDILPSSDPRSTVTPASRPATCGRCHPGAGPNFARGRVHELGGAAGRTPAGVVRILYKALIAIMGAFFLAYIAADLIRSRRRP
jgi:hypothetical protein